MASAVVTWIKRLSVVSVVALTLNGCDMYTLEELRQTTPSGTPFQSELSRLYLDYATVAERDYDWSNSWHFADKGLMLAYGKDMPPEDLNNWNIPDEDRLDMEKARAALMAVLTPDLMRVQPTRTAEAQFYFDCWVKEQDQNWRDEEINNCRENLTQALIDLNAPGLRRAAAVPQSAALPKAEVKKPKKAHKVAAVEKIEEPKPDEATDVKDAVPESTSYAVFFEPDKAEVSEPGMNVITEVIKSLHDAPDYVVILHSSKDHPGKAAERIQVIKKLLTAGGIKESAIRIGSGKTEVESGKPATRRVEIFLNE